MWQQGRGTLSSLEGPSDEYEPGNRDRQREGCDEDCVGSYLRGYCLFGSLTQEERIQLNHGSPPRE